MDTNGASVRTLPSIAYRSPLGRVQIYDHHGALLYAAEPGEAADQAWHNLATAIRWPTAATWIDRIAEREQAATNGQKNRATGAPQQEELRIMNEKTEPTKPTRTRQTRATRLEAELYDARDVLAEIAEKLDRALGELKLVTAEYDNPEASFEDAIARAAKAARLVEWCHLRATNGDLEAWYRQQMGI